MQLHVADGGQAVEPGVGRCLHDLLETLLLDSFFQLAALRSDLLRKRLALDQYQLALFLDRRNRFLRDAKLRRPARHRLDKITAGLGSVGFDLVGVHTYCFYWFLLLLADFDSFIGLDRCLQFLSQLIEELIHIRLRFQIGLG